VQYESAEVGAEVTYWCNAGFIPAALQMSVCDEDRTWTPDPAQLVCREPPPGDYCVGYNQLVLMFICWRGEK